jgi:phosphopantothenoylcysteine synthetase/decarboxylase
LACDDVGMGAMASPESIASAVAETFRSIKLIGD